jgi:hypothetical protein
MIVLTLCVLAAPLFAQQPVVEEPRIRFRAVDIFVNTTNAPLAAYQLEFAVTNGVARVVGIEGGEHPAFRNPPFYDPKAIQRERVIIAALTTEPASTLPSGKTRVATIHLQISGSAEPEFDLRLQAVAGSNGDRIPAEAGLESRMRNE